MATSTYYTSSDQSQIEYEFVGEKPNEDYFCPVNFKLLLHPQQTSCCGHHISREAASKLLQQRAPCPLCKTLTFNTYNDKYFCRRVEEVKVFCPYKKRSCDWIGEVGALNKHVSACSLRMWNCVHCKLDFDQHMIHCPKALIPCENNCDTTFLRPEATDHKLICPLETVECGFYGFGCTVKILRKDLAKHMEKTGMQHLIDATVSNLKMTTKIRLEMEDRNREITTMQKSINDVKQIMLDVLKVSSSHGNQPFAGCNQVGFSPQGQRTAFDQYVNSQQQLRQGESPPFQFDEVGHFGAATSQNRNPKQQPRPSQGYTPLGNPPAQPKPGEVPFRVNMVAEPPRQRAVGGGGAFEKLLCGTPGCSFKGYRDLRNLCPDCYEETTRLKAPDKFPLV
ncbi:TNF receptor-associated factor 5-like [Halichondria panicea]|uniref:TNF receptor-associated factor 5-like n=1 Tax=Halichondria panicea TaxID=6063 RepID=UPI00312B9428